MHTFVPIAILAIPYVYLGFRLVGTSRISTGWQIAAWTLLAVTMISVIVSFRVYRMPDRGAWSILLIWFAYTSIGTIFLTFILVLMRDLGWFGAELIDRAISLFRGNGFGLSDTLLPADPDRRQFLMRATNLGVVALAGSLITYGVYQAKRLAPVVTVDIPIPGLAPALEGFRIVQISDTHVSDTFGKDDLRAVVERANGLNADVVAFTGDLVDGFVEDRGDEVAPIADLRARHGVFFVTGNHEYYWNGPAWVEEVRRLGLIPLINEHRLIVHEGGRVLVAGATDYSTRSSVPGHHTDPAAAKKGAPEHDVSILLAHQPISAVAASQIGYDLQLSGHTHGGQFFPVHFVVAQRQPFIAGLHKMEEMWVYVSRGAGYWGPPIRIGAPSEITLLTLRSSRG